MRRSTRSKRPPATTTADSSDDEDDEPLIKKIKTPSKKNKIPRASDESSSESDIENYLQPVDKIDLMSSFFDIPKKNEPTTFDKVEKNIFDGVTRLSDSDSDEEMEPVRSKSPAKPEPKTLELPDNGDEAAKLTFKQLEDYTKQIEEAKKSVAQYEAKKKKKEDNALDISKLLKAGEKVNNEDSVRMEDFHSSDFESCESDDGWEEIKVATQEEKKDEGVIPKDGLQITVDMPDAVRKKKKSVDLLAAMKRRLNRIRKENQVLVHKVHLLCWIGHGNYVNDCINSSSTLAMALSLLPSSNSYPSDRIDLKYLEDLLKWFKRTMKMVDKSSSQIMPLDKSLQYQISNKEAWDKKMLCYIFVALLRALGVQCRLILSFQVEPLRPPASELHSVSTKNKDENPGENSTKASTSKEKKDSPSTSKKNEDSVKKNSKKTSSKTSKDKPETKSQLKSEKVDKDKMKTTGKQKVGAKTTEPKVSGTNKQKSRSGKLDKENNEKENKLSSDKTQQTNHHNKVNIDELKPLNERDVAESKELQKKRKASETGKPKISRNNNKINAIDQKDTGVNTEGLIKMMVNYDKDENNAQSSNTKENIVLKSKQKAKKEVIKVKLPERPRRSKSIPQLDGTTDQNGDLNHDNKNVLNIYENNPENNTSFNIKNVIVHLTKLNIETLIANNILFPNKIVNKKNKKNKNNSSLNNKSVSKKVVPKKKNLIKIKWPSRRERKRDIEIVTDVLKENLLKQTESNLEDEKVDLQILKATNLKSVKPVTNDVCESANQQNLKMIHEKSPLNQSTHKADKDCNNSNKQINILKKGKTKVDKKKNIKFPKLDSNEEIKKLVGRDIVEELKRANTISKNSINKEIKILNKAKMKLEKKKRMGLQKLDSDDTVKITVSELVTDLKTTNRPCKKSGNKQLNILNKEKARINKQKNRNSAVKIVEIVGSQIVEELNSLNSISNNSISKEIKISNKEKLKMNKNVELQTLNTEDKVKSIVENKLVDELETTNTCIKSNDSPVKIPNEDKVNESEKENAELQQVTEANTKVKVVEKQSTSNKSTAVKEDSSHSKTSTKLKIIPLKRTNYLRRASLNPNLKIGYLEKIDKEVRKTNRSKSLDLLPNSVKLRGEKLRKNGLKKLNLDNSIKNINSKRKSANKSNESDSKKRQQKRKTSDGPVSSTPKKPRKNVKKHQTQNLDCKEFIPPVPLSDSEAEDNSLILIQVEYEKEHNGSGDKIEIFLNEDNSKLNCIPQLDGNADSCSENGDSMETSTDDDQIVHAEGENSMNNDLDVASSLTNGSEPLNESENRETVNNEEAERIPTNETASTNGITSTNETLSTSSNTIESENGTNNNLTLAMNGISGAPDVDTSQAKNLLQIGPIRDIVINLTKINIERLLASRLLVVNLERFNVKRYFQNLKRRLYRRKRYAKLKQAKIQEESKKVMAKKKTIIKIKWPVRRREKRGIPQVDGYYDTSSESDVPADQSDDDEIEEDVSDVEFITSLLMEELDVLQVDGANDKKEKPSGSKPNLKKLKKPAVKTSPLKDDQKRLKISLEKMAEHDSDEEFSSPRKHTPKKTFKSPKLSVNLKRLNTVNVVSPSSISKNGPKSKKTAINVSKYHSPSKMGGKLDVRNDIINLIKGRISEQKHIDKRKMVRKPSKKNESESDSDYAPEPIQKKHHESDDEFVPKTKVKRRVQVKNSSDESVGSPTKKGKVKKQGIDVWCEVFLEAEEKWISVDVVFGQVHCVNEIYSRATHPVGYILAWNNDNSIKDITARYCQNFNTVTRKLRIDAPWWQKSICAFEGKKTIRDKEEDDELQRQQLEKPLPKTITEYKNHPLYALTRHLLKFEAIYPPDASTLGFVRGEPVYSRSCVYTLHSRDIWLKQAKVVRLGEKPYKIVKARPKYDKLSNTVITDQLLEIFGPWQVQDYEPPTAENGVVPRNAFGNVDLFKSCMLPKGCVHLKLPGLNKVARKLNIDCASAIIGFDFHGGWSHPMYDGFVVCQEFEDQLVAAWEVEQEELDRKEEDKIEKRVYGNWKRLIKGLLIREKLKAKYNFGELSKPGGDKKKKSKSVKFCTKKRRVYSDNSSDSEGNRR